MNTAMKIIRGLGLLSISMMLFGLVTTGAYGMSKEEINVGVKASLERFDTQVKGGKEYRRIAKGMLVIPNVTKAAFIVGGQYGQGALMEGGKTEGYYSLAAGSVGYQIGAEKYDLVIVFTTQEALKKFMASEGWEAGVDGEVTLVDSGVDVPVGTLVSQHPVLGFVFDQKGLMAGISVKGAKFTRINPN